MSSRLLGPDGRPVDPPTLREVAKAALSDPLVPIVEALALRNAYLQEAPWQARVSRILDAKGRPYLTEVK